MEKLKATLIRLANSNPNNPLTPSQLTLLDDKLLSAFSHFSAFKTPSHPTYSVMIQNAINKLDEVNGSSAELISKYIEANYDGLPWAHTTYLRHHLNKLTKDGEIVFNSTSRLYTTSARAVLGGHKSREKQHPRVYFTLKRERKVDEGVKGVVDESGTSIGVKEEGTVVSGKSEVKRRKRCLRLQGDEGVRGDVKDGGEEKGLVVERVNEAVDHSNGNVILLDDEECKVEGTFERENGDKDDSGLDKLMSVPSERVDNDDTGAAKLMIVPFESADNSSSTLSSGGDDHHAIELVSNMKESEPRTVPSGENIVISGSGGMIDIWERINPVVICGLEEVSKQKQLVYSRKRLKGRQEGKKVSLGSTPKRSKVSQVNKKFSPVSKPSSSPLAVTGFVPVLDEIRKKLLFQRRPETKFSPVDQSQHACVLGGGYVQQLERPEYIEPLHSSSRQELHLIEDEDNLPLQKVLDKFSKEKQHTLVNATGNTRLEAEVLSKSLSKLQLELPSSEISARMTPVTVPDLSLTERGRSSQLEANLIPHETGPMVSSIDKMKGELETDGGILFPNVGPSNNTQIEMEKQQNQSSADSPMSEQSLQNHEHKKEVLERQGCENIILENLEAQPVSTFVNCGEVKRKLRESPRFKLPVSPHNLEQKNKEQKKGGWERPQIQPMKSGRGRPRKCPKAEQENLVALSNVPHHPLEGLFGPTIDQHLMRNCHGGLQGNLEAVKIDDEACLNSLLEPQEESFEMEMGLKSLEKGKILEKDSQGRPQKLLESSPEQQMKILKTRGRGRPPKLKNKNRGRPQKPKKSGRGRPRKETEKANEDPATSNILYLEGIQQLRKDGQGRPWRQHGVNKEDLTGQAGPPKMDCLGRLQKENEEAVDEDPAASNNLHLQGIKQLDKNGEGRQTNKEGSESLSEPLNVVTDLEEGRPDLEKELNTKVFEQLESKAQRPNLRGGSRGRPHKNSKGSDSEGSAASKNLDHLELNQLRKAGPGRPRKHKRVKRKDSGGQSDPLDVVSKLEERLPDQEKELKGEICKQSEIEAEKPTLRDGSRVEPEKSPSEVLDGCETQLSLSFADEKQGNQLAQEQEELQHCHDYKINQGESECQVGLSKIKSEKVTVSSNYPLRSRMNH